MVNLIASAYYNSDTGKLGIGFNGNIPWKISEDLQYFKKLTKNNVVVMGMKTYNSIGNKPLPNRINLILTNDKEIKSKDTNLKFFKSFNDLNNEINRYNSLGREIYIIGGNSLYEYYITRCTQIFLTQVYDKKYECDTFFPEIPNYFSLTNVIKSSTPRTHMYLQYSRNFEYNNSDYIYKDLISKVLTYGKPKSDRTGTGTISLFGETIKFNISKECPILTTKKVAWKTCIKELLWFLRGETDAKILQKQNVHIWNGNSSRDFLDKRNLKHYPEGECGKIYGWQIRHSGGDFSNRTGGVDQLAYIENLLDTDPFSRRILWNLWNPSDLDEMSLTCCHYSLQLYVIEINSIKYLSGLVTLRSNDLFLGNPFNIFSYYVLIRILCLKHNMQPKDLIFNIGDAHIYKNHISQVKEQLSRTIRVSPRLNLKEDLKTKKWEDITVDDFELIGYFPHPSIKADMAI